MDGFDERPNFLKAAFLNVYRVAQAEERRSKASQRWQRSKALVTTVEVKSVEKKDMAVKLRTQGFKVEIAGSEE